MLYLTSSEEAMEVLTSIDNFTKHVFTVTREPVEVKIKNERLLMYLVSNFNIMTDQNRTVCQTKLRLSHGTLIVEG